MTDLHVLEKQRQRALDDAGACPPRRVSNPFFGVGPITDGTSDEVERRRLRFEFEAWLESRYRKLDDTGRDIGAFTAGELARSMHRGYPADKILCDMMREIHRYFEFPKANKIAVGLGGGHSGFTVCVLHLLNTSDLNQHIFIDTSRPETPTGGSGGFFRQSWGAQLIELHRKSRGGDESRLHFADGEGAIPSADKLDELGIRIFIGVGHETTGATTYTQQDMNNLLEWLGRDPDNRHAVLDVTSMLGAMPWKPATIRDAMSKICMFTPFQKAIGGVSGYFIASFTPQALALIERNQSDPCFAIPRQFKLAAPVDPKRSISGTRTVQVGPFYDPEQDKMLGGIINTYSILAFAETTFGLLRCERMIGPLAELNRRSGQNRETVEEWIAGQNLLQLGVANPESRGTAVTLLKIVDPDISDPAIQARIVMRSKQLLGYEGITHPNGEHERGLDVARYVNAFPGTPGDYRAWIGGIRLPTDVTALLENIAYAYGRAKVVVLEEEMGKKGKFLPAPGSVSAELVQRRTATVLIADPVGLRRTAPYARADHSEVQRHIEARGGVFHDGPLTDRAALEPGRIHFFYQPDLSTEAELLPVTQDARYDAVIAAATFLPADSVFPEGGVRIGAGTGNMGSRSWGGSDGVGGSAPLMNTPSFNSRATAQMVFKSLLRVLPDLDVDALHRRVVGADFDTGKNLKEFPTEKLESTRIAVVGYGNIGRQVAKLAKSFGMHVTVHAREKHRPWIESEGFAYAATIIEAAKGAAVITPHVGLGGMNREKGEYANAGIIGKEVLFALSDNAVLINFDRGELVDVGALDAALTSGKVRHASIDADLFRNADGSVRGPLAPYLPLEVRHRGKVELLPHVAADTDHPSRVEGAKQAVDQIIDAIVNRRVTNLKGDLPEGYSNAGAQTVPGVGAVTRREILSACGSHDIKLAREATEELSSIWGALSSVSGADRLGDLIDRHGSTLVRTSNLYRTLMERLGIEGRHG
ncbi:NAD(P)-dependent oxidoreductase [Mesorhizobium sp. KR9-304]|uniref:NAD(P)-dependent oxidoreductase n=1 Tax=Mesorhizobium sp. KR9-304 TaxID=3156614 RepID=UPI0032B3452E